MSSQVVPGLLRRPFSTGSTLTPTECFHTDEEKWCLGSPRARFIFQIGRRLPRGGLINNVSHYVTPYPISIMPGLASPWRTCYGISSVNTNNNNKSAMETIALQMHNGVQIIFSPLLCAPWRYMKCGANAMREKYRPLSGSSY